MCVLVRPLVLKLKKSVASERVYLDGSLTNACRRDQLLVAVPKPIIAEARQHGPGGRRELTLVANVVVGALGHVGHAVADRDTEGASGERSHVSMGLQEPASASS